MTRPWLAMPAATMAIWSGVDFTSYCPIADCAAWGALRSAGTVLVETRIGMVSESPKPNLAACARIFSPPSSRPSDPKAVLHEISSAWMRVVVLLGPQARPFSLGSVALVSGRSSTGGPGTSEFSSVSSPVSRAAAAVTTLNVDPGG